MDLSENSLSVVYVIILFFCFPCYLNCLENTAEFQNKCSTLTFLKTVQIWFEAKAKYTSGEVCKNLVSHPINIKEQHTWFPVADRPIFVYSAFYEKRIDADGPAIRIIAAGYQKAYNDIDGISCQLWYEDRVLPISVEGEYQVIYKSTLHPDMWCSHFIICKLPSELKSIPHTVTVTPTSCLDTLDFLEVLNRDTKEINNKFATCISPIYANFRNWSTIIEMFEMHKILGASEVLTYKNKVYKTSDDVLQHYTNDKSSKVTVLQWILPVKADKTSVNLQRAALNDCLYRLGHKYKFVTIQDLDEVIVPRKGITWPELFFNNGVYDPKVAVYMFQHFYFRRNETDVKPYFITQNSFWRTETVFPEGKIRCKSMYNAEKAISVDLHYHYKILHNSIEYLVDPNEAVLHHYRHEPMEVFRKKNFNFVEDKFMETYKANLSCAFDFVVSKLNFKTKKYF